MLERTGARLGAAAAVLALTSGCHNKDATPVGTNVLRWEKASSTRPSFPSANVGKTTGKDVTASMKTKIAGTVALKIHLDTAEVTLTEDGKQVTHAAPINVSATVADSGDCAVTAKCSGPDYPLAAGAEKLPMELRCTFNLVKGGSNEILGLTLKGDGSVVGDKGLDVAIQ